MRPRALATYEGVLVASSPGRIHGLSFPDLDWRTWPTRHLTVLWTHEGPSNSRGLVLFAIPMLLLGLGFVWGFASALREAWATRRPAAPRLRDPVLVILGTNLVPAARAERDQADDLRGELRAHLAARRRYRFISLGSLVLLACALASLWPVWSTLRAAP